MNDRLPLEVGSMAGLLDEARAVLDAAVAIRRRIHRHPEIGLSLPRTQQTILEALDGLPLTVSTGQRTTSVVAVLEGSHPGPTVLLRGDMDALPMPEDTGLNFASEERNTMHACGHDAHVAMLATAAGLLADHRAELHGRVLLMFQPGEEGYHGARIMIEEGLLDGAAGPEAAFAIHVISYLRSGLLTTRPGPFMASSDRIEITVKGAGGHASAPHRSLDPIPVAAEIVTSLQTMMGRRVDVFDPAVLTIGRIQAGTTNNVIPEAAVLEGTVRALSSETREAVLRHARRVAEGVAAAHGLSADWLLEPVYPPTVNDEAMADFALDVATDLLGAHLVEPMKNPNMGAEDFSYLLQRVPGAMVYLGVAPPELDDPPANHSNRMLLDEPAMANGIAFYAALALRHLDGSRPGR
jgi:amidohydrolase